ncbi:hypothetical protein D9M70_433050 [compost metagenome]
MLARQDALEETDELRRHRHVDHEVRAGEGEDDRHLGLVGDQRVGLDAVALAVQQRDHQRPLLVAGVDAPDQVGALVAVKRRGEQLDAQFRVLAHPIRQAGTQLALEAFDVARQVVERHVETVVGEDLLEGCRQVQVRQVAARLRRPLVAAQRRPGGVDEHAAVADLVVAEQAAEDRVVPGLRQLIVEAQVDQLDVGALHQRPLLHVEQRFGIHAVAQALADLGDLVLVEGDPRRRRALGFRPLRLLEARPGAIGDLVEMVAVIVETIEDQAGDIGGRPVLRHGEASGDQSEWRA